MPSFRTILNNRRIFSLGSVHYDPKNLSRKKYWSWFTVYICLYFILLIKFLTLKELEADAYFAVYSIVVSTYIFARFGLSFFYEPDENKLLKNFEPTVTFAVPCKNEEDNIRETLLRIANSDYPKAKIDIITINDGSTDNTLEEMRSAGAIAKTIGVNINIINLEKNKGKRPGMARCIREAKGEIIVFVDSDSFVEEDTLKEMLKYFVSKEVAVVTAHTLAYNSNNNILTKLQSIHYFISYKVFKSTESLFGTVTCCPGCCSAYRRRYILPYVSDFEDQLFMGAPCTYGDDRSLTNLMLMKGYHAILAPTAIAHTIVPDNLKTFFRQQLRWKKSWTKESLRASRFFWKKNIIMSSIFYLGLILTVLSPFVVFRALVWYPLHLGRLPVSYLIGLVLTSCIFSLYYKIYTNDKSWFFGILYSLFYSLILNWQLPYALLTLKDPKWGTR